MALQKTTAYYRADPDAADRHHGADCRCGLSPALRWRVLLFGASYQLAVELREDYYRQLSRQHPEFYLRHRTGDLMAIATNDVDRVVFAAGEGVLTLVDSLVMGCAVLIMMSTQISWQLTLFALLPMPVMAIMIKRNGDALHERFKLAQVAA